MTDVQQRAAAKEFAAYWKEFLKKEELLPQLKKALGVDMEENPNGLIIFPDIFVTFHRNAENDIGSTA